MRPRWSRWLVVPSGWLLFVCLVVPTFRFCDRGAAVPMVLFPPTWPCFVAGAIIALAAAQTSEAGRTSHGRRLLWFVRLCGVGLVLLAGAAFSDVGLVWPPFVVLAAGVLLLVASWRAPTERASAANASILAVACAIVGLALTSQPNTPVGAYLYAGAAAALVVGCALWLVEASWPWRRATPARPEPERR